MTFVRATSGLTLITLVMVACVWWRQGALAQASSAPGQNTIAPGSSNAGDLATAIANPNALSGRFAPARSMVPDFFSQDASERPNPLWAIPLQSLTATRERPIFSPSRRPPPRISPPPPVVVQPERLSLTLVGAITGENAIAIFRDDNSKAVVRLRIGQSHSGWSLERVTQRDAILRRNGEIATFALPSPAAK
jgi:general secretion pathway protein N